MSCITLCSVIEYGLPLPFLSWIFPGNWLGWICRRPAVYMRRFGCGMRTRWVPRCSCAVAGSCVHTRRTSGSTTRTTARQCRALGLCPASWFTCPSTPMSGRCSASHPDTGEMCGVSRAEAATAVGAVWRAVIHWCVLVESHVRKADGKPD